MAESRRPRLFGPALAALAFCVPAAQAWADSIFGFEFYGQLDPLVTVHNDGVASQSVFADNANANSRVGLRRQHDWDSGPTGRFVFETGLGFRQSSNVAFGDFPLLHESFEGNIRKVDYSLTTRRGRFHIGQGSMATDGVAFADFSDTDTVSTVSLSDLAGGYAFRFSTGALSQVTINEAYPSFDGPRLVRVRYDTPDFKGLTFSAAYGWNALGEAESSGHYDVALRYEGGHGPVRLSARAGFLKRTNEADITNRERLSGSFAAEHESGFSVALSLGVDLLTSAKYAYTKIGYKTDWLKIGQTALSVDFYSGGDTIRAGSDANSISIGAVQDFDKRNLKAYAVYRVYDYSDSAARYRDASTFGIGMRWQF